MKKAILITVLCTVLAMLGCASRSVERVDSRAQIDLSGRWHDLRMFDGSNSPRSYCSNSIFSVFAYPGAVNR